MKPIFLNLSHRANRPVPDPSPWRDVIDIVGLAVLLFLWLIILMV